MKSKAIVMALLAFAFQAQAVPVSQEQAELAARAWVVRGETLGVAFGQYVDESSVHETQYGDAFYTVKMYGSGMIVMSADTDVEPVLAFMPLSDIESALAEGSPLRALLEQDLSARRKFKSSVSLASVAADSSGVASKWRDLIAEGAALEARPRFLSDAASPISTNPGDLRVAKIVQSEWSQSEARGKKCYNYYTPKNSVCGCVATALAQLLRYHHGPKADGGRGIPLPRNPVEQLTRKCSVDGVSKSLTMAGGTYDWANMPLCPAKMSGLTESQCQAIGKLTSDVGIAHCMSYTANDSGAYTPEHAATLVQVFGYRQAVVLWDKTRLSGDSTAVRKAMFSNFDVACPVTLSIRGTGGHSIVADGYGYNANVPYVHLNMGWAGSFDMWYNLPHLEDVGYSVVEYVTYNAFPDQGSLTIGGAATAAVLSGRTLDEDGKPVGGCKVSVFRQGETESPVYEGVTTARGVWGAILPAGAYDVTAVSDDGEWRGEKENILLKAPAAAYEPWVNYKVPVVRDVDKVGNSWGNDMTLSSPKVQIVVDNVTNSYSRLDRAIAGARGLVAVNPGLAPVLEIISDVEMKGVLTVDFPCVIRSKDGPFLVTRKSGSAFEVAAGFSLALENVTFSESVKALVKVAAGGRFILGDGVDMGIGGIDLAAVRTADDAGFTLAATLEAGFAIDCATAHGAGARFGRVDPGLSPEEAATSAAKIVNIHDAFGEIRGKVDDDGESLVWAEIPVPLDEAVGYFVSSDGATNTAARLDRLFPMFMAALNDSTVGDERELVITESGSLSNCCFTGHGDFTILGGVPDLVISNSAGVARNKSTTSFVLTDGVMTIRNLAFEGFSGNPFVTVNGTEAGLVLGHGAALRNIECATGASPVTVKKGSCRLTEDSEIVGCKSLTSSGGGVYLAGADCELTMNGGVISNCSAKQNGGGVYAHVGAAVSLAGPAVICDNLSGNSQPQQGDDLYLNTGVRVTLVDVLDGGRVGIRAYESAVNKGTAPFATGELGGLELETTARSFFKNRDTDGLVAVAEGTSLKWGQAEAVPEHQPLPDDQQDRAYARVTYDGKVEYWESALWLFEALSNYTGTAVVELLKDDFFDADITIRGQLTLESSGGDWTFARKPDVGICVLEGASLTIGNATLKGVCATDDAPSGKSLIKASGGTVTLEGGARIEGVLGDNARDAGAVTVWKGGTFRMESGSEICGCTNLFVDVGEGAGNGGAVLIDNESQGFLLGGRIVGCAAYKGGGVSVANKSEVHVGNDMTIEDNVRLLDGSPNNLQVHDLSLLYLDAKLTGRIGYVKGVGGDGEIFGQVADSFEGTPEDMAASARLFSNDETGDIGAAVADAQGTTLLVWCDAVAPDGTFVRDDVEYHYIEGGELLPVAPPVAVSGLSYRKGVEQVGVEPGVGYALSGNVAVDAGTYQATATLRRGFAWEDGDDSPKTVEWSIAKAVISLDGVTFSGATFVFDGKPHYIRIAGQLPDGVKVSYENNDQTAVGTYAVKALFAAEDSDNCELSVSEMTADLVIIDQPVPPPPPPPLPTTNDPTPIAFQSIRFDTEAGKWELVVTNGVKDCWYSLWGGTELKLNERGLIGTEVVAPAQADADGPVIFRVAVPDTDRQWFWRALAEPGEVRPEE